MTKEIKDALPIVKNNSIVAARGVSDESGLAQYIQTVQKTRNFFMIWQGDQL